MENNILFCPRGYRNKGEAETALEKEVKNAKQTGHSPGWSMLKLYFCRECGLYHIWPRRPARKLERKMADNQIPAQAGQ